MGGGYRLPPGASRGPRSVPDFGGEGRGHDDTAGERGDAVVKTLARERDKDEIRARLRAVRPDSVRRWGRMSVHQMVCHVADAFRMATGEKAVRPRVTLLGRTLVKGVALYLPLPWPPGLVTSVELDQENGGTPPADFAADVAEVAALLDRVTAPTRRLQGLDHPVFGRMSDAAWLRWGYLHTDHHLRQFGA